MRTVTPAQEVTWKVPHVQPGDPDSGGVHFRNDLGVC
jgi:hypothetical protein